MSLSLPERLLKKLGVDEPHQINLQKLYEECNLELEHCDDMTADAEILIAPNHSGIITLNRRQHAVRQRFSIAHELGHWHLHKTQSLFECNISQGSTINQQVKDQKEREADSFAANLLLPPFMLKSLVNKRGKITFDLIKELSKAFQTSISATAIQITKINTHPVIIAVYNQNKSLAYFNRSNLVSEKLWPAAMLSRDSYAFNLTSSESAGSGIISAGKWFDCQDENVDVFEESYYWHGQILSIITIEDSRLMSD